MGEPTKDPWQQEAEGFKGSAPRSAPDRAPSDDWKVWQTGSQPEPDGPVLRGIQSFNEGFGIPKSVQNNPSEALEGIKTAVQHPSTLLDSLKEMGKGYIAGQGGAYQQGREEFARPGVSNKIAGGLHMLESGIPFIGPSLVKADNQIGSDDKSGAAGTLAAAGLQTLAMHPRAGEVAAEALPQRTPKTYAQPEAVERLNRAIDAPAKEMPRVRTLLNDELNTVARTAKERNMPITSRADAANVSRIAAENDPYRKTFIEPNANLLARAPDETLQPISKLDARLSKINEIRGKKQVMADTTPEKALELDAEANFLRDSIAEAVGKKMGIDPQIVRDARQHYGQIGELGDRFQLASDRSINPYGNEGPRGVTQIVPSILERYLYGPMADRATAKTFSRFKPEPANPLTFQPAEPKSRSPFWLNADTESKPVGGLTMEPPDESVRNLQGRVARNANALRNRPQTQFAKETTHPIPKIGEERPLFEVQDNSEASRQYLKEREAARQARKQEK